MAHVVRLKHYRFDPSKEKAVAEFNALFRRMGLSHSIDPNDLSDDVRIVKIDSVRLVERLAHPENVAEMATAMLRGVVFLPVVSDGPNIQDGHHRWAASKKAGFTHIPVRFMYE